MKIGLVRRGYSPTGGAENYLRRLADALAPTHEPVLITTPAWPRDQWPPDRALITVADHGNPQAFAEQVRAIQDRRAVDLLFSLERVWQCDCYRAGDGVHRAWLERRAQAEPRWKCLLRPFNRKHRHLLTLEESLFAHGGAQKIIANSELVRQEIIAHYGTPAGRIDVVYNGLPAEHFHPITRAERDAARAAHGFTAEDYVIVFAGTGWERKGLAHVLRALDRLPDRPRPTLLVAGRGNPRPYLRKVSARARDYTRFVGPTRHMRALYAAADVFAAPTLYDPFSNGCLEALAAGLPVLTTRSNGFAEIITPGVHGEVLAGPDHRTDEALAAALKIWSDPEKRRAARPVCAAHAAEFTIERNVAETLRTLLPSVEKWPTSEDNQR